MVCQAMSPAANYWNGNKPDRVEPRDKLFDFPIIDRRGNMEDVALMGNEQPTSDQSLNYQ
jgi:hypothetical protein